jgi:hypothetical protein
MEMKATVYNKLLLSCIGVILGAGLHAAIQSSVRAAHAWVLLALAMAGLCTFLFAQSLSSMAAQHPSAISISSLITQASGRAWLGHAQGALLAVETTFAAALLTGALATLVATIVHGAFWMAFAATMAVLVGALVKPSWSLTIQSMCTLAEVASCLTMPIAALVLIVYGAGFGAPSPSHQFTSSPTPSSFLLAASTTTTATSHVDWMAWSGPGFRHALSSMTFAFGGLVCMIPMLATTRAHITQLQSEKVMGNAIVAVTFLYAANMLGYGYFLSFPAPACAGSGTATATSFESVGSVLARAFGTCTTDTTTMSHTWLATAALRLAMDVMVACSLLNGAMSAFASAVAEVTTTVFATSPAYEHGDNIGAIYHKRAVACVVLAVCVFANMPLASVMSVISNLVYMLYLTVHVLQNRVCSALFTASLMFLVDDVSSLQVCIVIHATCMLCAYSRHLYIAYTSHVQP